MRDQIWLRLFTKHIANNWKPMNEEYKKDKKDATWTNLMGKIMGDISRDMNCYVARLRPDNEDYSGEYFNLDAVFLDNVEKTMVDDQNKWDPFLLPKVIVELENSDDPDKIAYCLWKLLCVRADIRVLICYQKGPAKVKDLADHLWEIEQNGNLMRGEKSDLLVIIGDDSLVEPKADEYFSIYEWQYDKLKEIENIKWDELP